jgi:hypothetical protein
MTSSSNTLSQRKRRMIFFHINANATSTLSIVMTTTKRTVGAPQIDLLMTTLISTMKSLMKLAMRFEIAYSTTTMGW